MKSCFNHIRQKRLKAFGIASRWPNIYDIVESNFSILNCRISDNNIALTQEFNYNGVQRKKSRRAMTSVDFRKAFDTIRWGQMSMKLIGYRWYPQSRGLRTYISPSPQSPRPKVPCDDPLYISHRFKIWERFLAIPKGTTRYQRVEDGRLVT